MAALVITSIKLREGTQKKRFFLGLSPKQRTPPTGFPNFHEQKVICLEWSNMPFKHDIVLSLNKV